MRHGWCDSARRAGAMMALLARLAAVVGVMGVAGCAAGPTRAEHAQVSDLRVLAAPSPVGSEPSALPNGVMAQVYALSGDGLAMSLPPGRLSLRLYDGRGTPAELEQIGPYASWSYSSEELADVEVESIAGPAYGFLLRFEDEPPEATTVTLTARFQPRGAPEAVSAQPVLIRIRQR